jgi:mannose-1-phosphate guanylyltransferase/phosphomannomutase
LQFAGGCRLSSGWEEVFSDQVNTGIYILEPEVLDYIEANQQVDFSKDVFPKLLAMGKDMYAIVIKGKYWCDIGMTHTKVIQGIHMVQRSRRAVCPIPRRTRTIDSVSTLWHS